MKRCLFLVAMAIAVSSMSGCIVEAHHPHSYHGGDHHHSCDRGRGHDCHHRHH